jgi:ubiquinone/menaquinone biosynthesis C-methylase UbiE
MVAEIPERETCVMESQIAETKKWLDSRYSRVVDGRYYAHQPIYGYDAKQSEPNSLLRIARTYHLLKLMDGLKFGSFLDVGGGEGYVSGLIQRVFGVEPITTDLSSEACRRAREIFGVHSVSADGSRLPFPDRSFDLVLCSEVIEHLPQPAFTISELVRVARKFVIVTTSEFCPLGELERAARLWLLDYDYPHAEKNWFTPNDFTTLLGAQTHLFSQMDNLEGRSVEYLAGTQLPRAKVEQVLEYMTSTRSLDANHDGVIALAAQEASVDRSALEESCRHCRRKREFLDLLLDPFPVDQVHKLDEERPGEALVERLMCLACGGSCRWDGTRILCTDCQHAYEVVSGVPVMLATASMPLLPIHTPDGAIELLTDGDQRLVAKVTTVVDQLHGERPVCTSPALQKLAQAFLRVYWLVRRPESVGSKVSRIISRISGGRRRDYSAIEARIFSR